MLTIDDYNVKNVDLALLIKKYHLEKDTWFAIQLNTIDSINQMETLYSMGFNLASHTVTHQFLNEIPIKEAEWEMKESKKVIDGITGKNTDWLITPRGRGNQEVYNLAFKLGYKYIRTTKLCDDTDRIRGGCHLSYPREDYKGMNPFEWAKQSTMNHYWLHTEELIRFNKLDEFEDFLKWLTRPNKNSKI